MTTTLDMTEIPGTDGEVLRMVATGDGRVVISVAHGGLARLTVTLDGTLVHGVAAWLAGESADLLAFATGVDTWVQLAAASRHGLALVSVARRGNEPTDGDTAFLSGPGRRRAAKWLREHVV